MEEISDVDRHRFADMDPVLDPTFQFHVDPDPGPTLSFTHVGKLEIFRQDADPTGSGSTRLQNMLHVHTYCRYTGLIPEKKGWRKEDEK